MTVPTPSRAVLPTAAPLEYDPGSGFFKVAGTGPSLSQMVAADPAVQRAAERLDAAVAAEQQARERWEAASVARRSAAATTRSGSRLITDGHGTLQAAVPAAGKATVERLAEEEATALEAFRAAGREVVDRRQAHAAAVATAQRRIVV